MAGANVILVSAANWDGILFGCTPVCTFVCLANIRARFPVCIDPAAAGFHRRAPKERNGNYDKNAAHLST
jgi:hypothetical protein